MPSPSDGIVLRNPQLEKALLDYILQVTSTSTDWWSSQVQGSRHSIRDMFTEFRLRYDGKRSVASLYQDTKTTPFRGVNIGIPMEQVMGEFLIPTFIANTHDLEPSLQARDEETDEVDEPLTVFHETYQKSSFLNKRSFLELSDREILTVGGVYHKLVWGSQWKQVERPVFVFAHPSTGPVMLPNPQTGEMDFMYADPSMPEEAWPSTPDGAKLRIVKLPSAELKQAHEGPRFILRPYESVEFPPNETRIDPNEWDWLADNYTVSPFYFLGKEGDPFEGKLQNIERLFSHYRIRPEDVAQNPDKRLCDPIPLKEWHGKFPVTKSKRPVEIIAIVAEEPKLLLGWRLSPFTRRPYFNRQVRTRRNSPLGVGIPETVWSLRNAVDASVCQDIDAGNLYNHPPGILNSQAMLEDEEYEELGSGALWVMQGDPRAAFAYPNIPASTRNPIERENWVFSMAQRIWGVTDLNLNAPTSSLSPNVSTATGTMAVLNQGNLKFGHLTKRLTEVDSKEYDFCHEMFRSMLSNPRTVSVKGKPFTVDPKTREQFFKESVHILAVGNGVSTNPTIRGKTYQEFYLLTKDNPFIGGDMENLLKISEMLAETNGIKLNFKEPDEMKFLQLVSAVMKTPGGQQRIVQAIGQSMQELQAMGAGQGAQGQGAPQGVPPQSPSVPSNGNGAANVR